MISWYEYDFSTQRKTKQTGQKQYRQICVL